MRTPKNAIAPRWADPDNRLIHMSVVFEELEHLGSIPFLADPRDEHDHGRELHARALKGEFGPILPYMEHPHVLDTHKTLARRHIEKISTKAHVDAGGDHSPVHMHRLEEARRLMTDPAPVDAAYPLLAAMVGHSGGSVAEVAKTIRERDEAWRFKAGAIEKSRMDQLAVINNADSISEVQKIHGNRLA